MDGTVKLQPVYGGVGRYYRLGPFFIALSLFDIIGAIILWVLIKDPEKHHPPMTEQPLASHR